MTKCFAVTTLPILLIASACEPMPIPDETGGFEPREWRPRDPISGPADGTLTSHFRLANAVSSVASISPELIEIEPRLFAPTNSVSLSPPNPALCAEIDRQIETICASAVREGIADSCHGETTHVDVRGTAFCSNRMVFRSSGRQGLDDLVIFDIGNGPLPSDHQFTGCETVIERHFREANIAEVPADLWDSPRLHLMVNPAVSALRKVSPALCKRADDAARATCKELDTTMPFIGNCHAETEYDRSDATCHVRLTVEFRTKLPQLGVFSAELPGTLQFGFGAE